MKPPTLFVLFSALVLAGCDNNAFTRRLLKQKPTAAQASGTYTLAVVNVDKVEDGLNAKIIAQQPVATIVIQDDGTVGINNFPILSDSGNFNYAFVGFKSFKATSRILPVGKVSAGGSNTADVYGIAIDPTESTLKTMALSFVGETTPDGLVLTLYDGTRDQMLEFTKQAPTAGTVP